MFFYADANLVEATTDPIWDEGIESLPVPIDSGTVLSGFFYVCADFDGVQNELNTGSYEGYPQATDGDWEGLANFSGRTGPQWRRTYGIARLPRWRSLASPYLTVCSSTTLSRCPSAAFFASMTPAGCPSKKRM